jgi:two-component sensor histidine kinase
VRLALLVLIAAIPLLALSATIVLQNYRLALAATAETAARLRESAIARHVVAITGAEQMMQALAQVADLTDVDARTCHDRLAGVLALQPKRYSNLAVFGTDIQPRCSALPIPPDLKSPNEAANRVMFAAATKRGGFLLGPIRISALTGHEIIPAAYPILRHGAVAGFLYAGLRIDWFAQTPGAPIPDLRALWVADATGRVAQVAATDALGLPPAPLLRQLEAGPVTADARSAGGQPYAYASALVGDGYSLIVAYPATFDRAAATGLLIRRLGQLGLLLLLGLAAVAIGAHLALVEPLTQLSRAVARWRTEGRFDAAALHDPPTELRELATTFAEATSAIAAHDARHKVAVSQQELLMREIHHRVKNNLQIVASLLNLQASRIRVPEARAEFASARDRVRALATLHRHLYMHGEIHTIDMPGFLTELCNQLFQAMGEMPGRRIGLSIEASPLQMSSDQAVPLSLIVTETVSNAVKYAFPGGRPGRVSVRLTTDSEMADLVVEDDGVGIPAGRTETESGPRDGIGISLIRGFARQLGATLTVHEDGGTRYSLRVPLNPALAAEPAPAASAASR